MGVLISRCLDCFQSKDDKKGHKTSSKRASSKKIRSRGPSQEENQPKQQQSVSKQHLLSSDNSHGYNSVGNQSQSTNSERKSSPSYKRNSSSGSGKTRRPLKRQKSVSRQQLLSTDTQFGHSGSSNNQPMQQNQEVGPTWGK